jgi:hypothetical protein
MRRFASHLGPVARAGLWLGCLLLHLSATGAAYGQGRYPYGDFGYGVPPSPWTPSWYFRGEYTPMWAKGALLPPLFTTSPAGTDREDAGVLGEPGTTVLVGGERVEDRGRNGGRITIGHWFDIEQTFAVEARYWVLGEGGSGDEDFTTTEGAIIARPFFNPNTGEQDAQLIAFPDVATGAVRAEYRSEVHSVDVSGRYNWLEGPNGYVNLLAGYRFFRFREALAIDELLFEELLVSDKFITVNDFNGFDFGATFGLGHGCWLLDVTTRIALGSMREELEIQGRTQLGDLSQPGGFLAAPSNIGTHVGYAFAAIPEVELKFGFVAFDCIRLSVGYNILVITKAIRAGHSIDTTVNPDQLAPLPLARGGGAPSGAARPAPILNDSSLWLQGVTVGAEVRW